MRKLSLAEVQVQGNYKAYKLQRQFGYEHLKVLAY